MLEKIKIQNQIYEIRGKQIMLDSNLAKLYQCKNGTKEINQAVTRNKDKFPERYSWKLTREEYNELRSQFVTTNLSKMTRTLPITIITNKYNNSDYTKYKEQYKNISLKVDNKFHDRFIIIDEKILYHSGASFKDLGKKCFAISKIINDKWLEDLLKNIKN